MQDTDLFFGKLRDNIALGKPDATDEEMLEAARLSGVESFIAGHPMGYDMPISEGGRSLSGGQKQAIGLARVLIRKPRVLFLDEPTAHFDIRSETEFLERLKALRDERMTIIISTHRLSLLGMVDRLLLFDNGRLVADGPRDKVMAILQGKPAAAAAESFAELQHGFKSQMPPTDFAFANDIRAAAALRTPRTSRMLLTTFLAMLVVFLIWAHFAVLDEVKRGNGRVVPSRQTQVVQTLEGGIVGEILVQEGAIVQQGQSLMRIDNTKFASEFGEIRERRAAMAARVARLEAEAQGRSEVTFPDQLDTVVPASVATETSVFKLRAQKVAQDVDVLNQQVTRLTGTLKLLDRELTLTRRLFEQKVVPEIEMLRLDRQATEMRGQLAEAQSKIANTSPPFNRRPMRISPSRSPTWPCWMKTSNPRRTAYAEPT